MYKELELQIEEAKVFFGIMDQTLTTFKEYYSAENRNLVVPEGYNLPIYGCVNYKFNDGLLTVMPWEYARYTVDNFTLYGDIINMAFYFDSLTESIASGTLSDAPEDLTHMLDVFVKLKKERMDLDKKGFDLSVKIINDLKRWA